MTRSVALAEQKVRMSDARITSPRSAARGVAFDVMLNSWRRSPCPGRSGEGSPAIRPETVARFLHRPRGLLFFRLPRKLRDRRPGTRHAFVESDGRFVALRAVVHSKPS